MQSRKSQQSSPRSNSSPSFQSRGGRDQNYSSSFDRNDSDSDGYRSQALNDDRSYQERNDRDQKYSDLPEYDLQARHSSPDDSYSPYSDEDYGSTASERSDWNTRAARPSYSSYRDRDNDSSFRDSNFRDQGQQRGASFGQEQFGRGSNLDSGYNTKGRFGGVGPKGYTRSDDRLKEEICDMLTRHSNIDASDIEVEVKNGEVTLTGNVPERRMKHMAEDIADQCQGVKEIHNQIKMKKMDMSDNEGSTPSSLNKKKTGSSTPASNH